VGALRGDENARGDDEVQVFCDFVGWRLRPIPEKVRPPQHLQFLSSPLSVFSRQFPHYASTALPTADEFRRTESRTYGQSFATQPLLTVTDGRCFFTSLNNSLHYPICREFPRRRLLMWCNNFGYCRHQKADVHCHSQLPSVTTHDNSPTYDMYGM